MDSQKHSVEITCDRHPETHMKGVDDAVASFGAERELVIRLKARSLQDVATTRLGDPQGLRALNFGRGVGSYHAKRSVHFSGATEAT